VFVFEAKDDGGGGDYWSYKSGKAPVKSSPPKNQHPVFLQAVCPTLVASAVLNLYNEKEHAQSHANTARWL